MRCHTLSCVSGRVFDTAVEGAAALPPAHHPSYLPMLPPPRAVKVTAVNEVLKVMSGGTLPPDDSWLTLVRRDDGGISAHIWQAGSSVRW